MGRDFFLIIYGLLYIVSLSSCFSGQVTCRTAHDCDGGYCYMSRCLPPCQKDADCYTGDICRNLHCTEKTPSKEQVTSQTKDGSTQQLDDFSLFDETTHHEITSTGDASTDDTEGESFVDKGVIDSNIIEFGSEKFFDEEVRDTMEANVTRIFPNECCSGIKGYILFRGHSFTSDMQAMFDGKPLNTTLVSPQEIHAAISYPFIQGKYKVWLERPNRWMSDHYDFSVTTCGGPIISSIEPVEGAVSTTISLLVNGGTFKQSYQISFGGETVEGKLVGGILLPTSFVNQSRVEATLSLKGIEVGVYKVRVKTDFLRCGSTFTSYQNFAVKPSVTAPIINRILPYEAEIGKKTVLIVYGLRLHKDGGAWIGNTLFGTKVISDTQAEVILDLTQGNWTKGNYSLFFQNPDSQKSNGWSLTLK